MAALVSRPVPRCPASTSWLMAAAAPSGPFAPAPYAPSFTSCTGNRTSHTWRHRAGSMQKRKCFADGPSSWPPSVSFSRRFFQASCSEHRPSRVFAGRGIGMRADRSGVMGRHRGYATGGTDDASSSSSPGNTGPTSTSSTGGSSGPTNTAGTSSTSTSGTSKSRYRSIQQLEARHRSGPFSWKAGLVFIATGIGLIMYFRAEKARLDRKRIAEATKGIGKPKVGGPFDLIDLDGNRYTHENLKGKYSLVYFGFTHCPDICPEELDKMAKMIDLVNQKTSSSFVGSRIDDVLKSKGNGSGAGSVLRPIFITCDPKRDTPAVIKSYLQEFHPALIGLTGTYENIKATCKVYRVYFSTPEHVKPGQDYLVDHSIYFYLMDPDGDFIECIGRQDTAESGAKVIVDHIKDWKGPLDRS